MKLGIISDIHSNIVAFRACMNILEKKGCEEYIFLGDFISDTPYPSETMDYLYEILNRYPTHCIRGNREEYMLGQQEVLEGKKEGLRWKNNSASGNLLFTLQRLTDRDLDYFENLPISFVYQKEGLPAITFCHGSPCNTRELMQLQGENTAVWLQKIATDYLVAAHTHHPGMVQKKGKTYMNTGSCGIAIDKVGLAECLILESVEEQGNIVWHPEFLDVPYDYKKVIQDIFSSGLYAAAPWFLNANIHVLSTGIDRCAELVQLAQQLSSSQTEQQAIWPDIEEHFFEAAAAELGIPNYLNHLYDIS